MLSRTNTNIARQNGTRIHLWSRVEILHVRPFTPCAAAAISRTGRRLTPDPISILEREEAGRSISPVKDDDDKAIPVDESEDSDGDEFLFICF
jgi:hypothetical protein